MTVTSACTNSSRDHRTDTSRASIWRRCLQGHVRTRVQAIKERERQRETLARDLPGPRAPAAGERRRGTIAGELRAKLADWRSMLRAHVPQARQMIRKLVVDRFVFTADPKARLYRFSIPGSLARFFNGLVHPRAMASQTIPSWNQLQERLQDLSELRNAGIQAA